MTTAAELAEVARIYKQAELAGNAPTKTVQDAFGYERHTAVRRVSQARQRGLIGPVPNKSRPGRNPKAIRIAEALGVEYEALVAAVSEHAGGDLRLS